MTGQPSHRGHCRCGAVKFSATQAPNFAVYCHCDDCRRSTGAPVAAFVGFMIDQVAWDTDSGKSYRNGSASRLFCRKCGTPVGYQDDRVPERVFFYTAIMERPEDYPPTAHTYAGEQLPWLHLTDDLPRHSSTLVIRPKTGVRP